MLSPAATAAADPPLEPPATYWMLTGFLAGPAMLFSVEEPIPNSSIFVFPIITAPSLKTMSTAVALYVGIKLVRIFEPHVVLIPFVHRISLTAIGMPLRRGTLLFRLNLLSALSACFKAVSRLTVIKALISVSLSSILLSADSVISHEVVPPFLYIFPSWVRPLSHRSIL